MDGVGNALVPGPPPGPKSSNDGVGLVLVALGGVIVALLVVLIIVLVTKDDGTGTTASTVTTNALPTSEPATTTAAATTAPTTTAAPTSTTTAATTVDLPDAASIYNQPVDGAVALLVAAGLTVDTADIGCSNSTSPGMVRQVTVGSQKNVRIIYGKPTDTIDEAAANSILPGDAVTVWTPSSNPCP